MKHKQLLLGLLFIGGSLNAQTDFRPGYIVKLNNDTVFGTIDYRGDKLMGEVCRFKKNESETNYSPNDISEFRFIDSKYFVSKKIDGKNVFLEFLIKGKVGIYYLRDYKGDHYYLEKDSIPITEIPYEKGIKYVENTAYWHESKRHIGVLNYFMQDAPDLQKRIASLKEPTHENLISLAEDYHNKVCKDRACIIYEKKINLFQLNIDIVGGLINYQNAENLDIKNYFQGGVLTHLWMPRVAENIYFKSGILFSTSKTSNTTKAIYKIPIQIEYKYPKGIVRPVFAFGINLYEPINHSLALSGGVNIRLDKSLSFVVYYDLDFNPVENTNIIPKNIL